MVKQNKQVNNREKIAMEKIEDNYEFYNKNSDKKTNSNSYISLI